MRPLINWKTTVAGVLVIVCNIVLPLLGVKVPGFAMDPGAAITVGMGLILSKDYDVTGGNVKQ